MRYRSSEVAKGILILRRTAAAWAVIVVLSLIGSASASALSYAMNFRNYDTSALEVTRVSGAGIFRVELDFTCTAGGANWGQFDPLVEAAWRRGITILPIMVRSYPACEQAQHKRYLNSGDGNWNAWATWARAAVERYGINGSFWNGKANPTPITAWEVGNEPNLPENNPGGQFVQPQAYGEFLTHTANALQAGSIAKTAHGTEVISAGLYAPSSYYYGSFLEQMGATGSYTAVGFHPYSFFNGATGVAEAINNVRYVLNNFVPGGAGKALWITELGWPVAGSGGLPLGAFPVSEQKQAELLNQSFDWIQDNAASKNINLLTWYKIQDQSSSGGHWSEHTGLRRFDGSFRPAWYAFRSQTGAPAPAWHSPVNLGGQIVGDPDASSWGWGRLDVFARGTNDALHTIYFDGTNWSGWSNLGGPTLTSAPGAVAWGPNRIDVVGRASDGTVAHWWYDGSKWNIDNLGGPILGSPDISSWSAGRLDVFASGTDGTLQHKWFTGTSWSPWESLGGKLTSGPGAVSWGPNRIDVVARATDGSVAHWWFDGAKWASDNLGGVIVGKPSISSWAPGRLDVFVRGTNDALHHRWYAGSWSPGWENKGGVLSSGPGAVSWGVDRIDIFGRAPDGALSQWWFGS